VIPRGLTIYHAGPSPSSRITRYTEVIPALCSISGREVLGLYRKRSGGISVGRAREHRAGAFSIERLEVSRLDSRCYVL
jgi:hypothetical protein